MNELGASSHNGRGNHNMKEQTADGYKNVAETYIMLSERARTQRAYTA